MSEGKVVITCFFKNNPDGSRTHQYNIQGDSMFEDEDCCAVWKHTVSNAITNAWIDIISADPEEIKKKSKDIKQVQEYNAKISHESPQH